MPNAQRVFHERIEHHRVPREEDASDVFRVIGITVAFLGLAWGVAWMVGKVIKPGITPSGRRLPQDKRVPRDWEPITDLGAIP